MTTRAKGTPGPWVLDAPDPEGALALSEGTMVLANNAEPGRRLVAEVLSHDEADGEGRHDADAALIAAAPDLLEACQGLDTILTEAGELATGKANGDWLRALNQIRAAVRKAEGADE